MDDLEVLNADEGFARVLLQAELRLLGLPRRARRELERRWRWVTTPRWSKAANEKYCAEGKNGRFTFEVQGARFERQGGKVREARGQGSRLA